MRVAIMFLSLGLMACGPEAKPKFAFGEKVKVKEGFFKGCEGQIVNKGHCGAEPCGYRVKLNPCRGLEPEDQIGLYDNEMERTL